MISGMKLAFWIMPCCICALFLSNCANKSDPNNPEIVGPFDAQGNYREDWADNPNKWKKSKTTPVPQPNGDYLPPVASNNDMPPANSVPLPPKYSKPAPVIAKTEITAKPTVPPKPKVTTKKSAPEPVVVKSTSKPKAKSTVAKAKPKPKPKSTRYTVKQGDTLSAIAGRTGASVSAIRSANGISGSLIHPGQSLTIPKK